MVAPHGAVAAVVRIISTPEISASVATECRLPSLQTMQRSRVLHNLVSDSRILPSGFFVPSHSLTPYFALKRRAPLNQDYLP